MAIIEKKDVKLGIGLALGFFIFSVILRYAGKAGA
jgi:hypothetical protein